MLKLIKLFILILILAGCAPAQYKPVETIKPDDSVWKLPFDPPQGKVINSSSEQFALLNNPITFNHVSVAQGTYLQVQGLTDKAVEESINQQIKAASMSLLNYDLTNLPPYRGIEQIITPNTTLQQDSFDVRSTYNHNFVLSLILSRTMGFQTPKGEVFVVVEDGLTFDLNTGNQLTLSDILTNDVDAKLWFNDLLMSDYVHGDDLIDTTFGYSISSFVESFKGLRPNQKFYIDYNTLVLLFDFETPEMQHAFSTNHLFIQFSAFEDQFALPTRFITNSSVFKSSFINGSFLFPGFERVPFDVATIDINGYEVIQYTQLKSLNQPHVVAYIKQIKDELARILDDLEYTTLVEVALYFSESETLKYSTIDSNINIVFDESYISKRFIQSFKQETLLSIDDLIPYTTNYQSTMKDYIRAHFKDYTGYTLQEDNVILDITQLGVQWSGFEVVVEVEAFDHELTINIPYGVFDIHQLPMFNNTFARFDY